MAFLNNLKPVDYVAAPRLLFLLASAPHVLLLFASARKHQFQALAIDRQGNV
jgi:hypothetical protein